MEEIINYFQSINLNNNKIKLDDATLIEEPIKAVESHINIIIANKNQPEYIKPYLLRLTKIRDYIEHYKKISKLVEAHYEGQIKCKHCPCTEFYVQRNNIHYDLKCCKCEKHITFKSYNHAGSEYPVLNMATFYNGSICLTDIPKEKITEGKNGKKYLNVTLWVNDTPDQYGNIGSIQVSQTKEQREAQEKKQYIGNFKQPQVQATATPASADTNDDLPF
jgi:hypothetical protein